MIDERDAARHAEFDATFIPIRREWAQQYGITQSVPFRDE
jgi:hypothetical protein